jgi:hypothetical protein
MQKTLIERGTSLFLPHSPSSGNKVSLSPGNWLAIPRNTVAARIPWDRPAFLQPHSKVLAHTLRAPRGRVGVKGQPLGVGSNEAGTGGPGGPVARTAERTPAQSSPLLAASAAALLPYPLPTPVTPVTLAVPRKLRPRPHSRLRAQASCGRICSGPPGAKTRPAPLTEPPAPPPPPRRSRHHRCRCSPGLTGALPTSPTLPPVRRDRRVLKPASR